MGASFEFDIPTSDGVFLLRDVSADTLEAQRPASRAARNPGGPGHSSRGGKMLGAAGAVLLVRCAHQYSRPRLRLELLDHPPAGAEPGWQWALTTTLDLPTGRIQVDSGEMSPPADLLDIDAGAGPGPYGLTLGHAGRDEMRERAHQVGTETLHADADTSLAAWDNAQRLERYLIRIWPSADVDRPRSNAAW